MQVSITIEESAMSDTFAMQHVDGYWSLRSDLPSGTITFHASNCKLLAAYLGHLVVCLVAADEAPSKQTPRECQHFEIKVPVVDQGRTE